ncbi:MAG: hypothetical protein DI630_31460 [Gordonia sp. (in: high G+C Gram-positive bacteria)]|nr:MAG: hypothetical protein DI630_31460 [Gordonia sp. (in: high G+C Gram-positive bacteria)]
MRASRRPNNPAGHPCAGNRPIACTAVWWWRSRSDSKVRTAVMVPGGVRPVRRWAVLMAETRRRSVARDRPGSKCRYRAVVTGDDPSGSRSKAVHQSV